VDLPHRSSDQRAEVVVECFRDADTIVADEQIGHCLRLAGNSGKRHESVIDSVIADALDGDRPVAIAVHDKLHRLLADFARLAPIDLGDAAKERALQLAEGVAAHAFHRETFTDMATQQAGERTVAGELQVSIRVALHRLGQLRGDRNTPLPSWTPSDKAITQRPSRSTTRFTSAKNPSILKARSGM
jgi:hypothetical protein